MLVTLIKVIQEVVGLYVCFIAMIKYTITIRLSFEVRLTDLDDYYEIKTRMGANESRMIQGIDFMLSFAPTVEVDLFR